MKKLTPKKVQIALSVILCILIFSCQETPAGTIINVDKGNNDSIEVYKYYYDADDYVFIARFRNCPEVQTTTYDEMRGKQMLKVRHVTISTNDSFQFITSKSQMY